MAYVNLWDLITTEANSKHDLPNKERCQEIKNLCGAAGHFATELSLEVTEWEWIVKLFCHEGPDNYVRVAVNKRGGVTVTRQTVKDDMREERSVSF